MDFANDLREWSVADVINVPTGTYFSSALGEDVGLYRFISATGCLIDGAGETTTLTIQGTNDEDRIGANWATVYGYDSINHLWVNQMTITNGTLVYAWDFDYWNYKFMRALITTTAATNTVIIKARGRT